MISGGSTPTVKKSRGPDQQGQPDAQQHEATGRRTADPADDGDVDRDRGERDGDAERDDGAAGLAALVPDGPGVAHKATLGRLGIALAGRRAGASAHRPGRGRGQVVVGDRRGRRTAGADTSTRDSSEPTAAL